VESCEVRHEVEMLPVVPAENPPSGLQTLLCSHEVRNGDAKAVGRIGLAGAAVFAGGTFPAGRSYNLACFVQGAAGEEDCLESKPLKQSAAIAGSSVTVMSQQQHRHGQ
jgi:hypothetical protein